MGTALLYRYAPPFPAGTRLDLGAYLVVVLDPDWIQIAYPGIEVLGDFQGRLSNAGETVRLHDSNGATSSASWIAA